MRRIDSLQDEALYSVANTRYLEQLAQSKLPAHTLMQRAGLAVARLALAVAPHSQHIWIACGPGNNGGDGFEAAVHLQHWGKACVVTWLGNTETLPNDAAASLQGALAAGVCFAAAPQDNFDLCIDALLGVGARPIDPNGTMADWIAHMNASQAPVVSIDLPSGLNADTGASSAICVRSDHTLSLLTLKPGLFTAQGRDLATTVWLDTLGLDFTQNPFSDIAPDAFLLGQAPTAARLHASHKGSYGDVAIIGGASGMVGAALLAASAALHSGAGRVFVGLLDTHAMLVNPVQPELMLRAPDQLLRENVTTVIGCGAGLELSECLSIALQQSAALVIDADGLNILANDTARQHELHMRQNKGWSTVLTPHPLEAARLLGCSTIDIQNKRLHCAEKLAHIFGCTVVLKGSGTLIAQPGFVTRINPTGNARLATAGSGDVLAGMIGARLAQGLSAWNAACSAVYQHGQRADRWPPSLALTASELAKIAD